MMTNKSLKNFFKVIVLANLLFSAQTVLGQTDSTNVDYAAPLKNVTIASIKVTGADNYEDYMIVGFSGLEVGQKIDIPGDQITQSIKKFWKQGYFANVKFLLDKVQNDSVWLTIALEQLPKITEVNYSGLKKSEIDDLKTKLEIKQGKRLTKDVLDRSEIAIKKYLNDKGYANTVVAFKQKADPKYKGSVILDVKVDRKNRVKVDKIFVTGNKALSINQIDRAMKKTNRAHVIWNIFRSKKFIESQFENDKTLLLDKYNDIGYRDAEIVTDSVVPSKEKKDRVNVYLKINEGKKYYFGNIVWTGNTVYPSQYLDAILNIKKGDVYNKKELNKKLTDDPDMSVNALYKNNGYLFMQVDPVETGFDGDSINYEMHIFEGKQATINKVVINGNDRLYENVIRRELRTKPGGLYSQIDLVRSLRELAQLKQFNEEKLYSGIDMQPNYEDGTVDITYNLESKTNDQVNFSAGYGQTGIVLSLGLTFSNFAIQNLFKPDMYRIVPQGEGQTLSIKAQASGKYYQSYSVAFTDPWFGGKRPNTFSLSGYYSVQTGLSDRYYNSYYNTANYLNSYYYGNSSYYNNSNYYQTEYDEDKFIKVMGGAIGIGTRLNWPDDYFSLYGQLNYQHYNLSNWFKYYYGFANGIANNLNVGITLSRSSIDNPLYTRSGSSFTFSVEATPPYSLFDGVDYSKYSSDDQEMIKWIEYHKWKFQAKMYTPLSANQKLVLYTRAEYGFLGYYNKYKRSPFEKFYLGGDGTSGYTTAGTENIALRGYSAGSLTPFNADGYNGNLYTKLTLELHYPLLLQQSTNIWAIAFVEAGNAWSEFNEFNPFDLKRSAGVGVRVYLPMFGLLGVDWGYGFDNDNQGGGIGGSQFSFVLGQEF